MSTSAAGGQGDLVHVYYGLSALQSLEGIRELDDKEKSVAIKVLQGQQLGGEDLKNLASLKAKIHEYTSYNPSSNKRAPGVDSITSMVESLVDVVKNDPFVAKRTVNSFLKKPSQETAEKVIEQFFWGGGPLRGDLIKTLREAPTNEIGNLANQILHAADNATPDFQAMGEVVGKILKGRMPVNQAVALMQSTEGDQAIFREAITQFNDPHGLKRLEDFRDGDIFDPSVRNAANAILEFAKDVQERSTVQSSGGDTLVYDFQKNPDRKNGRKIVDAFEKASLNRKIEILEAVLDETVRPQDVNPKKIEAFMDWENPWGYFLSTMMENLTKRDIILFVECFESEPNKITETATKLKRSQNVLSALANKENTFPSTVQEIAQRILDQIGGHHAR